MKQLFSRSQVLFLVCFGPEAISPQQALRQVSAIVTEHRQQSIVRIGDNCTVPEGDTDQTRREHSAEPCLARQHRCLGSFLCSDVAL